MTQTELVASLVTELRHAGLETDDLGPSLAHLTQQAVDLTPYTDALRIALEQTVPDRPLEIAHLLREWRDVAWELLTNEAYKQTAPLITRMLRLLAPREDNLITALHQPAMALHALDLCAATTGETPDLEHLVIFGLCDYRAQQQPDECRALIGCFGRWSPHTNNTAGLNYVLVAPLVVWNYLNQTLNFASPGVTTSAALIAEDEDPELLAETLALLWEHGSGSTLSVFADALTAARRCLA